MRSQPLSRLISIAPMMDWTDRHCRYFLRLFSKNILLYTEMVVDQALKHAGPERFLAFNQEEHPLAVQFGGCHPSLLAECAKAAEQYGYDEVNFNVGCPSDRVKSGRFGACLMAEPELVADCVKAMQDAVSIPVTVKTRIGIDHQDSYEALAHFVQTVAATGCQTFIIHARKAWLQGLSPKENREIPPLDYDVVYRLKKNFSGLEIIVNGGIRDYTSMKAHLENVDGVMIGREAYQHPYFLAEVDRKFFGNNHPVLSREAIIEQFIPYVEGQLQQGVYLKHMLRHVLGLFHGEPGARYWRRYLSQNMYKNDAGIEVLHAALK
jgi:tRNA-dihydrouridine synthase A